jgi:hypothetical protein
LKLGRANSSERPYQKTLHKNRAGGMADGEGPEFKPQYRKKKKMKFPDTPSCLFFLPLSDQMLDIALPKVENVW